MADTFCGQCGAALPPRGRFCIQCGAAVTPAATGVAGATAPLTATDQPAVATPPPPTIGAALPSHPMASASGLVLADVWLRLGAQLVDWVLLYFVGSAASFLVAALAVGGGWAGGGAFVPWTLFGPTLLVGAVIAGVYYTVLVSRNGQTVGALLVGVRVVDTQGRLLTPRAAFVRWLAHHLSLWALGLGYLLALRDRDRQTWHDKLAGALVVPAR